jgi:hypothetical protein
VSRGINGILVTASSVNWDTVLLATLVDGSRTFLFHDSAVDCDGALVRLLLPVNESSTSGTGRHSTPGRSSGHMRSRSMGSMGSSPGGSGDPLIAAMNITGTGIGVDGVRLSTTDPNAASVLIF